MTINITRTTAVTVTAATRPCEVGPLWSFLGVLLSVLVSSSSSLSVVEVVVSSDTVVVDGVVVVVISMSIVVADGVGEIAVVMVDGEKLMVASKDVGAEPNILLVRDMAVKLVVVNTDTDSDDGATVIKLSLA